MEENPFMSIVMDEMESASTDTYKFSLGGIYTSILVIRYTTRRGGVGSLLGSRAQVAIKGEDMIDAKQVQQQAALSLERLWPRLSITFRDEASAAPADWYVFETRLRHEWKR